MAHKKQRFGKATIKSALEKARGNVTLAAEVLGVSRQTVYTYMERYPDLVAVRHDAENYILDIAEAHVEKAVLAGDMDVIKFYLRTKGRVRGYVTSGQVVVSGDEDAPLVVKVVRVSSDG
jgi:hypothetical protein